MNNQVLVSELNKKLPGDIAMWFFILAELTVFALFFIGFAVTEQLNQEMFALGKAKLHAGAGLVNTIALITSSLFVAFAVTAVKSKKFKQSVQWLIIAQCFAVVYLVVKGWEYQSLFAQGIDIETNTFFTLYFLITLFHFMHVLLGMVILAYIMVRTNKGDYQQDVAGFESGACYWHMVDMLWIILFPLIYVI
ncbi:cytochrome c oxidase subunit 3 family protein [Thalassotalea sp. G2M2-11]|uniref:cytochrome c oxidase subunit 3 family protein n=1 Tax=Thalassotalea sp. G2M2-11 TaxID=2787627 RepID=UPI001F49CDCE|nr:cytochrome c oxidase subunit 3 family protein [Thalassotalea sp. G2M2-11]